MDIFSFHEKNYQIWEGSAIPIVLHKHIVKVYVSVKYMNVLERNHMKDIPNLTSP